LTQLSQVGELGLLAELEARGLIVEVQHDAAQLGSGLVATQDALVEDVHFRLDWLGWRELGFRAAAVNVSDLAASGAQPEALLVTLAVPPVTEVEDVVAFYEGLGEAGVPVVGGDTTSAGAVVISVTALGHSDRVPGRDGARPGDLLVVTGPLGAAGAAFRERRYARPPVRVAEGRALAQHAHALLDISDGLAVDASHIARRSGVRCVLDLDAVPLAEGATIDDVGFGEDFELLAAVDDAHGFAVVGRAEAGEGVVTLRGRERYEVRGWEHFTSAGRGAG
jgi:thiamine-monophosphate kinase